MRCSFCAEEVHDDASVCRHCGNDLKIPEFLVSENHELKERVTALQRELGELRERLGRLKK
jgi:predicted amidophosphoribosyltransferase